VDQFARTVIAYHGCSAAFARQLLLGQKTISAWNPSRNDWDWLGHGIYFWEHSPQRAIRWARERQRGRTKKPAMIGAVIQLGRCFDLLDESMTAELAQRFVELQKSFATRRWKLPENRGWAGKRRALDCLVINDCLEGLSRKGIEYDTVRGAFLEGEPAYPTAGFSRETHIQIAVRNPACILGVFQPNLEQL